MSVKWQVREQIRKSYAVFGPEIEAGNHINPYDICPHSWNIFTPIEDILWSWFRQYGIPAYPQYPIGPYFVDFAIPKLSLIIEADGARWHQDVEKDQHRDQQLLLIKPTWGIQHITGSEINNDETMEEFILGLCARLQTTQEYEHRDIAETAKSYLEIARAGCACGKSWWLK